MAVDKAVDSAKLDASLEHIAQSVREKLGVAGTLRFPDEFELSVDAIEPGGYRVVVTVEEMEGDQPVVSATCNGVSVNATRLGKDTYELCLPSPGTWLVDVSANYLGTETAQFAFQNNTAFMQVMDIPPLNSASWAMIRALSDAGQAANFWSVGDRKAITLSGTIGHLTLENFTCYAYILGFDHNAALEGRNRIHFQIGCTAPTGGTDIALCDSICFDYESYLGSGVATERGWFAMNHAVDEDTNANNLGGWRASEMRRDICGTSLRNCAGTVIGALPEELRKVLKPVTKYTDNVGGGTCAEASVSATRDYIFLLSETEVNPDGGQYGNTSEADFQQQYAYYSAGAARTRYMHEHQDNMVRWWLRTPDGAYDHSFCDVFRSAAAPNRRAKAQTSLGIAPCFCV